VNLAIFKIGCIYTKTLMSAFLIAVNSSGLETRLLKSDFIEIF